MNKHSTRKFNKLSVVAMDFLELCDTLLRVYQLRIEQVYKTTQAYDRYKGVGGRVVEQQKLL